MNPTKCQRLIKGKRRMKGGRGQERLQKIIEYLRLYAFSSIIFHPRKFNHKGMKIIWRAQVASKFLLNHPEYTIMFDSAVVGVRKHSSHFLRTNLKGRITSKSFIQKQKHFKWRPFRLLWNAIGTSNFHLILNWWNRISTKGLHKLFIPHRKLTVFS